MKLLTLEQHKTLLRNGSPANTGSNHFPVARLALPSLGCTWLLTEIDPETPHEAFGLCDLGMGCPEYGTVSFEDLYNFRSHNGHFVGLDLNFQAKFPVSVYARAAMQTGKIMTCEESLRKYVVHHQLFPTPAHIF